MGRGGNASDTHYPPLNPLIRKTGRSDGQTDGQSNLKSRVHATNKAAYTVVSVDEPTDNQNWTKEVHAQGRRHGSTSNRKLRSKTGWLVYQNTKSTQPWPLNGRKIDRPTYESREYNQNMLQKGTPEGNFEI